MPNVAGFSVVGVLLMVAVFGVLTFGLQQQLDREFQDRVVTARVADINRLVQAEVQHFLVVTPNAFLVGPVVFNCGPGVIPDPAVNLCEYLPNFRNVGDRYRVVVHPDPLFPDAIQIQTDMETRQAAIQVASRLGRSIADLAPPPSTTVHVSLGPFPMPIWNTTDEATFLAWLEDWLNTRYLRLTGGELTGQLRAPSIVTATPGSTPPGVADGAFYAEAGRIDALSSEEFTYGTP